MDSYYDYNQQSRQPYDVQTGQFNQPFGFPFGQYFSPPYGPPFFQGGGSSFSPPPGPPPFSPGGGGTGYGPPSGPPPSFVPQQSQAQSAGIGVYAVDPGAIRNCLYRYSYIWLTSGRQFWAWLTFVGRRSVAGWRWTGFNWVYFGEDLRNISSFICY